jgi:gas vesicle protein GvpL/GvpF
MAQAAVKALRLFGVATVDSPSTHSLAEGTSLVSFRSLGAVVAPTRYSRPAMDDAELAEYMRILGEVQASSAVVPAPPGTVFRSRENLARWLELHYFTLTQAIGYVDGHAQARVLITKAAGVDPDDATPDETKESARQLRSFAAESMRVLRGQSGATVSIPVSEDDTNLVAQASFLVDVDKWGLFAELVAKEDQRNTDLDFRLTGPWPPYDFVKMEFGG